MSAPDFDRPPVVAVVGGGFTGTAFAVHLLRASTRPVKVLVIEPRHALGLGLAYGSASPEHRINVPSDRMEVLADDPTHFTRWLRGAGLFDADAQALTTRGHHYSRRVDFGRYMGALVDRVAAESRGEVCHVRAAASSVSLSSSGQAPYRVHLDHGEPIEAQAVVVTASHAAPAWPWNRDDAVLTHPAVVVDPWAAGALSRVDASAKVVIAGAGLSMCDMVVSLRRQGHHGPILAISRRALLPRVHTDFADPYAFDAPLPATARAAVAHVRSHIRSAREEGVDWRPVVDATRRRLPALWQAMPPAEQARALHRLRPFWDVHRFRMAPQVAELLDTGRREGWLQVASGRILAITRGPGTGVSVRWRSAAGVESDEAPTVFINCIGPGSDLSRSTNPLFRSLLAHGLARPDPLRLGLDCDADGRLRDASGGLQPLLRVAGPLARAAVGEVVGVPEASAHARRVAETLLFDIDSPHAT